MGYGHELSIYLNLIDLLADERLRSASSYKILDI